MMTSPSAIDLALDPSFSPSVTADMSNASLSPASEHPPTSEDLVASSITVNTKVPAAAFPAPKTDKPRPHVCTTCQRSFARLEHLKRHERSHTKEKPFECSQCTRCFARRDLLLRHQQKLHQATTPAARPRNRRESTTGVTPSRVRKNSMVAGNGTGPAAAALGDVGGLNGINSVNGTSTMRPRANTISHVDAVGMQHMMAASPLARGIPQGMHSRHASFVGLPMHGLDPLQSHSPTFVGMSAVMGHRGTNHGLPKLDTNSLGNIDFSSGLRSASTMPLFSPEFDFDGSGYSSGLGTTINPNALHYSDSPQSLALDPTPTFPGSAGGYHDMSSMRDSFEWLTGFENQMTFNSNAFDETAVDGSSPSAMSTGSQSGISDVMLDGTGHVPSGTSSMLPPTSSSTHTIPTTVSMWQPNGILPPQQLTANNSFGLDAVSTSFSELLGGLPMSSPSLVPPLSQANVHAPPPLPNAGGSGPRNVNAFFSTPPPSLSSLSPSLLSNLNPANTNQAFGFQNGGAPETPPSMNGSNSGVSNQGNHHASLIACSPVSTITDKTRNAIIGALGSAASQSSAFGMRKYSFTGSGLPSSGATSVLDNPVPSTADMQRYVSAYIRHFQPQFPFLHIPTLSFESSAADDLTGNGANSTAGGCGCLILSMAAIGALYELEQEQSRILFSMAKRMIQLYLDERRIANVRKADFRRAPADNHGSHGQTQAPSGSTDTPVWLVQAMLLTVVYGHNGSDKRAGEIAATHCAALVSLAQGAQLLRSTHFDLSDDSLDLPMPDDAGDGEASAKAARDRALWLKWKSMEERKRTLYAIFVLSSLLVSSYNHTPALTNSEILLDLPCDEEFFEAPTSAEFTAMGSVAAANHNRMTFHEALGTLLRASEKQLKRAGSHNSHGSTANHNMTATTELVPSSFGCFILINALHNYIWETRQRHHNRVWTNEETEKMQRHIEPALQAWQRAWSDNPKHSMERRKFFGLGSLSASAIPLLDLAYIRLYVNLSRSKEKFWQRNWDGLAEELSHGLEVVQHAEQSPLSNAESVLTDPSSEHSGNNSSVFIDSPATQLSASPDFGAVKLPPSMQTGPSGQTNQQQSNRSTSRREKHLRKAAFYAADSLSTTDKLGFTMADFANRDLPLQTALCTFDCAQVLAEWVATLQDRVGRYLGILGHDEVDLGQVPAIMLLEDEDIKLLGKIQEVLNAAESGMNVDIGNGSTGGSDISTRMVSRMQMGEQIGYAAKILSVTAYMLGKASVWPVTHLMAECLENHAGHMRARAEKSIVAYD